MTTTTQLNAGDFCWMELATSDLTQSKDFYTQLFGWAANGHAMPDGNEYNLFKLSGSEIAGSFEISDEMKKLGVHPSWGAYILVDDVDASTKKATALGATLLKDPFDVKDIGRMSVLVDPTQAAIYLWQSKEKGPANYPDVKTSGMFSWTELLTSDTNKAVEFYTKLFGWKAETADYNGIAYTSFFNKDKPIAGMMEKLPEWGEFPNYWGVYFTTDDFNKTVKKATSLGAEQVYEAKDIPEVGKITMFKDPQGVYFSIIKYVK